ncbi:hypothetical protein [Paracoccus sediminicola]|uniref:hypothetical protein n=1 Tax=Paracoccus sediminicola TaxID=3017783 RepID=UPI0022F0ECA7|nr:hypothetical protein [Paracoccus sediminicola]WBU58245.1 hypothetical protein PAF18_07445 [Paracoccus sediminicola]
MNEQSMMGAEAPDRDYALGFQPDGVQLLHRDGSQWAELGRAPFDGDLRAGLGGFAQRIRAANAPGLALVIPEDQILYTDLVLPSAATTRDAVQAGLDGLTPYRVEDLAFDYVPADAAPGASVKIAAVAKQTLQEAEDFAVRHGFAPDRFLAAPASGKFPGTPDFGATELAAEWARAAELTEIAASDDAAEPQTIVTAPPAAPDTDGAKDTAPASAIQGEPRSDLTMTEPDTVPGTLISRVIPHVMAQRADETPTDMLAVSAATVTGSLDMAGAASAASVNRGSIVLPGEDPVAEPQANERKTEPRDAGDADSPASGSDAMAEPVAEKPLSERARAFHERASEGRKARPAPTPPARPAQPGRMGLKGALPLVFLLLIALGIAAVLSGRETGQEAEIAATEPSASVAEAPSGAAPAELDDEASLESAAPAPEENAPSESAAADTANAVQSETIAEELAAGSGAAETVTETEAGAPDRALDAQPVTTDSETAAEAGDADTGTDPSADLPAVTLREDADVAAESPDQEPLLAPAETATSAAARMVDSVYRSADPVGESETTAADAPPPSTENAAATATEPGPDQPAVTGAPSSGPATVTRSARPVSRPADLSRSVSSASGTAGGTAPATAPARPSSEPPAEPPASRADIGSASNAPAPGAPASSTLSSSARPVTAPSRGSPAAGSAAPDPRPDVPRSPQPYERREQPEPTGIRPPPKPDREASAQGAVLQLQPAPRHMALFSLRGQGAALSRIDAPWQQAASETMSFTPVRLAQARPAPRPTRSDAVDDAVAAALAPERPATPENSPAPDSAASAPAASSGATRLSSSARPSRKPGNARSASTAAAAAASASSGAVEAAIAEAVSSSPAVPGRVALTPLTSSSRPLRRGTPPAASGNSNDTDAAVTAALADSPADRDDGTLAPEPEPDAGESKAEAEAAALAERRRLDEELQRQAEQRMRERAASDARAAAQAKAAAEARARAQAEAEAAAAARRNQTYRPPEIDNEPEVRSAAVASSGNAASSATTKGIDLNATQLIGTVGAGKASRGLIRLRNGKIVTVRLGDKINGGQITEIGNGGLQYVRAGRKYALPILNGR